MFRCSGFIALEVQMKIKDEAYEKERDLKRRSSADVMFGVMVSRLFRMVLSTIWAVAITLTWTGLGFLAEWRVHNAWVFIAVFAIVILAIPKTRKFGPVWGDAVRLQRKTRFRRQLKRGNELLVHMGIVPELDSDEKPYPVRLIDSGDEARLFIDKPISGVPSSKVVEVCRSYKDRFDAKRVRVYERGKGVLEVVFLRVDPLDSTKTITEPAEFDAGAMSVVCAVDSEGEELKVSFREVSGMVVGGIPGSGKTAGVTSFLLPLALSDDVELTIIDGKGGADWSAYEPVASRFVQGDEDLEVIRDLLAELYGEMVERVKGNQDQLGDPNFWNADLEKRRQADAKFKLLVIDECQGLFETAGRSSKEEKQLQGEILRYASGLVKRGRSAGVCAVFITQKPTSEALPTAIRDNAALRLAFRLTTSESERAVLGMLPDEVDVPRPTAIPKARPGGAVMAKDTGELVDIRFFRMENDQLIQIIEGVSEDE